MGISFNPLFGTGLQFSKNGETFLKVADSAARLALSPADGDLVVQLDNNTIYQYDSGTATWVVVGGPSLVLGVDNFNATPTAKGLSITANNIALHAADATNPGGISTTSQAIAGSKTFSSVINADAGVDMSTAGTLSIGSVNASIINIGNASATVNFNGVVNNNNVTNLNVADQLITINDGGGVGSASGTGFEIEEAGIATGYFKTSGDRNSFFLKAPNTAGDITFTPGIASFTIDQGSHNPVTLGTANGLSLATQALSLALSSGSTIGALSSTDWTTFNSKEGAITAGTTLQYWRGDKTFQTLDTAAVPENTNLYFTDERAQDAVGGMVTNSAKVSLTYVDATPTLTADIIAASLVNADISATANIDASKLGTGAVSTTEFNFLDGVTSAIQTQLNDKANTTLSNLIDSVAFNADLSPDVTWTAPTSRNIGNSTKVWHTLFIANIYDDGGISTINTQSTIHSLQDLTGATALNFSTNLVVSKDIIPATTETRSVGSSSLLFSSMHSKTLQLYKTATTNNVSLSGSAVTSSYTLNLPATQGTANQSLTNDGSGNLSWTSILSVGDITETSFTFAGAVGAATNVTGLAFANGTVRAFKAHVSVTNATDGLYQIFELMGIQKAASWDLSYNSAGDNSQVVFSITSAGQIQYVNSATNGGTMKFKATILSV